MRQRSAVIQAILDLLSCELYRQQIRIPWWKRLTCARPPQKIRRPHEE